MGLNDDIEGCRSGVGGNADHARSLRAGQVEAAHIELLLFGWLLLSRDTTRENHGRNQCRNDVIPFHSKKLLEADFQSTVHCGAGHCDMHAPIHRPMSSSAAVSSGVYS